MKTTTPAAKTADIPAGTVRTVTVGGVRAALSNIDGKFYAIEDLCSHDGGALGAGEVVDGQIECPRHGARFDARTGAVTRMPAVVPVRSFPVRVEGEDIYVDVDGGGD